MREIVERAARATWLVGRDWNTPDSFDAAPDYARDLQRDIACAALLAALDPGDGALVEGIARRLAEEATRERDALRSMQGVDMRRASPVALAIFKKDARLMLEAVRQMVTTKAEVSK